jgi:hypothetical protein
MEAGDYILICGKPKRILRTNDRFVVVEGGLRLTLAEAERFKRSSTPSPEPGTGQGGKAGPPGNWLCSDLRHTDNYKYFMGIHLA